MSDLVVASRPALMRRRMISATFTAVCPVDAGALAGYGERAQTRTDHLRLVIGHLSRRPAGYVRTHQG
jgi:hypothetical protein